jgi:hypothetical protein
MEATCEIMYGFYKDQLKCSGQAENLLNLGMGILSGDWLYLDYN